MQAKPRLNTPDGALKVFSIYYLETRKHGFDLTGKTILNVGSGDLIGLDALFLLFGAAQVISVDLNPGNYLYPDVHEQGHFFEELAGFVPSLGSTPPSEPWNGVLERLNGRTRYNTNRLHRIAPCDAACLPLRNHSVDFAFSNAVLEHVGDPEGVIGEIDRTLSFQGHTMHRVDLRDHKDFSRPLDFLKPGASKGGCNLWRAARFEEAFRTRAFHVTDFVIFDTCEVSETERASLDRPYCTLPREELGKLRFMVYAKKTGTRLKRIELP